MGVVLTGFRGAEGGGQEAPVGHAGLPGQAAAPAPDAADPGARLHAALL